MQRVEGIDDYFVKPRDEDTATILDDYNVTLRRTARGNAYYILQIVCVTEANNNPMDIILYRRYGGVGKEHYKILTKSYATKEEAIKEFRKLYFKKTNASYYEIK